MYPFCYVSTMTSLPSLLFCLLHDSNVLLASCQTPACQLQVCRPELTDPISLQRSIMIIIHSGSHLSLHIHLLPCCSTLTGFVVFQFPFKRFPLHLYTQLACIWRNKERLGGGVRQRRTEAEISLETGACQESHHQFHCRLHNSESLGSVLHFRRHQAT